MEITPTAQVEPASLVDIIEKSKEMTETLKVKPGPKEEEQQHNTQQVIELYTSNAKTENIVSKYKQIDVYT